MDINPKIFKSYDIRGNADQDLSPAVVVRIGQALGTYFQHACGVHQVVLGYDMRLSSPRLFENLAEGLQMTGCDILDIGMVATPVLYGQAYTLGMGGVMITGSHLAKEFNGFKVVVGRKPVFGDDIQAIGRLVEQGIFEKGKGRINGMMGVNDTYRTQLYASFRRGRPLKIVVDGGNGMGGEYAAWIFRRLGHEVTELYCNPDGNFPNHHPNPDKRENMEELAEEVRKVSADVGLAFDGDADRVGVVDEQGEFVPADQIMAWLATDILPRHDTGAVVIADVLSSQVVFDTVTGYGGQPELWASGHARIKDRMQELGAVFAGESSGHMFFADRYAGFDDGIYAAGRVAELLSESDRSLSAQIADLPTYYTTPEYRPHCPEDLKQRVIESVKKQLIGEKIVDVDGLRVMYDKGWGLLRPSGTEPVLSLRFEAVDEETALKYKGYMVKALRNVYPEVEHF